MTQPNPVGKAVPCCVCQSKTIGAHRLPSLSLDEDKLMRYAKWVNFAAIEHVYNKQKYYWVCEAHFEDNAFCNHLKLKLLRTAVPTLNPPIYEGPSKEDGSPPGPTEPKEETLKKIFQEIADRQLRSEPARKKKRFFKFLSTTSATDSKEIHNPLSNEGPSKEDGSPGGPTEPKEVEVVSKNKDSSNEKDKQSDILSTKINNSGEKISGSISLVKLSSNEKDKKSDVLSTTINNSDILPSEVTCEVEVVSESKDTANKKNESLKYVKKQPKGIKIQGNKQTKAIPKPNSNKTSQHEAKKDSITLQIAEVFSVSSLNRYSKIPDKANNSTEMPDCIEKESSGSTSSSINQRTRPLILKKLRLCPKKRSSIIRSSSINISGLLKTLSKSHLSGNILTKLDAIPANIDSASSRIKIVKVKNSMVNKPETIKDLTTNLNSEKNSVLDNIASPVNNEKCNQSPVNQNSNQVTGSILSGVNSSSNKKDKQSDILSTAINNSGEKITGSISSDVNLYSNKEDEQSDILSTLINNSDEKITGSISPPVVNSSSNEKDKQSDILSTSINNSGEKITGSISSDVNLYSNEEDEQSDILSTETNNSGEKITGFISPPVVNSSSNEKDKQSDVLSTSINNSDILPSEVTCEVEVVSESKDTANKQNESLKYVKKQPKGIKIQGNKQRKAIPKPNSNKTSQHEAKKDSITLQIAEVFSVSSLNRYSKIPDKANNSTEMPDCIEKESSGSTSSSINQRTRPLILKKLRLCPKKRSSIIRSSSIKISGLLKTLSKSHLSGNILTKLDALPANIGSASSRIKIVKVKNSMVNKPETIKDLTTNLNSEKNSVLDNIASPVNNEKCNQSPVNQNSNQVTGSISSGVNSSSNEKDKQSDILSTSINNCGDKITGSISSDVNLYSNEEDEQFEVLSTSINNSVNKITGSASPAVNSSKNERNKQSDILSTSVNNCGDKITGSISSDVNLYSNEEDEQFEVLSTSINNSVNKITGSASPAVNSSKNEKNKQSDILSTSINNSSEKITGSISLVKLSSNEKDKQSDILSTSINNYDNKITGSITLDKSSSNEEDEESDILSTAINNSGEKITGSISLVKLSSNEKDKQSDILSTKINNSGEKITGSISLVKLSSNEKDKQSDVLSTSINNSDILPSEVTCEVEVVSESNDTANKQNESLKYVKKQPKVSKKKYYDPVLIDSVLSKMKLKKNGPIRVVTLDKKTGNLFKGFSKNTLIAVYKQQIQKIRKNMKLNQGTNKSGSDVMKKVRIRKRCSGSINFHRKLNSCSKSSSSAIEVNPNVGVKFEGTVVNQNIMNAESDLAHEELFNVKNVFNVSTILTNVHDRSQVQQLCQMFIDSVYRLKSLNTEGTMAKLQVYIAQVPQSRVNRSGFVETVSTHENCKSNNSNQNKVMDYDEESNNNMNSREFTINNFEENNSDRIPSFINLANKKQMPVYNKIPVTHEVANHTVNNINNNGNPQQKPKNVKVILSALHDHSYNKQESNYIYLVKLMNVGNHQCPRKTPKLPTPGVPKKEIERHKKACLKLNNRVVYLRGLLKKKNQNIKSMERKIKYLGNIVCQEMGIKRIKYPKEYENLQEQKKKDSLESVPEDKLQRNKKNKSKMLVDINMDQLGMDDIDSINSMDLTNLFEDNPQINAKKARGNKRKKNTSTESFDVLYENLIEELCFDEIEY